MKKILIALTALAALFIGCTKEPMTGYDAENIKVDNSYVAIDTLGSSVTVNVTATEAWKAYVHTSYEYKNADKKTITVDTLIVPGSPACYPHGIKDPVVSWITVSPLEGSAGTTQLTITGPAGTDYRTQELKLVGASGSKEITVAQGENIAKEYTVSEILPLIWSGKAGGSPVIVNGIICKIVAIEPAYGNATYYISDDGTFQGEGEAGNWLQVYRGKWLNGEDFTKGNEIAVGDQVSIKGQVTLYGGNTPETVQNASEIISIKKSLVSVDPADLAFEKGDTSAVVKVLYSGDNLNFSIDEAGSKFLSITNIKDVDDTTFVTVHALENTSPAAREGVITFSSATDDDKSATTVTVKQAGAAVVAAISEVVKMADGTAFLTEEALVSALTTRGFVATDGTAGIYVYLGSGSTIAPAIGDKVSFAGTKVTYNGVPEVTEISNFKTVSNGNTVVYPTSNNITGTFDTYTADVAEFISVTGELVKSNNYYNITVPGATKSGSLVYPVDALGAADFAGKNVTVKGYFNGLSSNSAGDQFVNIIATSISEGGAVVYKYKKATSVTSGKKYLIAATVGDNVEVMETLAQSGITKTYGYPKALEVAPDGDFVSLESEDYAFTFTAAEGGYTIVNSEGKYIYQNGTYKTYNEGTEVNADCYWTVTPNADGTFSLTSPSGYTAYYDTGYGSYGVYNEEKDTYVMPCLYEFDGADSETTGPKYAQISSVDELGDGAIVLIAAKNGDKYEVMETLAQSGITKTYGYPKALEATADKGVITLEGTEFEFTVTKTANGYTFVNSEGKYIYQNGTYKTYNEGAEVNADCYWSITAADGAFQMTSPSGYTMYYDTGYGSYGVYNEVKETYLLPCLFKKK